jgi:ELWxxDGT repeat protein
MSKKITFLIVLFISIQSSISQITLLKDFAGSFSSNPALGNSNNCIVFNNELYFNVVASDNKPRLYKSDGTTAGSVPIKWGVTTNQRFISSNPKWTVKDAGNGNLELGYIAQQEGSTGNEYKLTRLFNTTNTVSTINSSVLEGQLTNLLDRFYYVGYNGSSAKNIFRLNNTGSQGNLFLFDVGIKEIFSFNNKLYLSASDGANVGYELYVYNPSTNSAVLVEDINPNGDSNPTNFIEANGKLYFVADDGTNGNRLYVYNGTLVNPVGTILNPEEIEVSVINSKTYLYLSGEVSGIKKLFFVDTQNDGFLLISNGGINPRYFTNYNGFVYYVAEASQGRELYRIDGVNVSLSQDINPNGSSNPKDLLVFDNKLYFSADDGFHGVELWSVDENKNVSMVEDYATGTDSFSPIPLIGFDGKLYINGIKQGTTERELFTYKETTASVGEVISNSFVVFPNPIENTFALKSSSFDVKSVEIYSILGKKMIEFNTQKNYNISKLTKGVYFVKITTSKGVGLKKIFKN